MSPILFLTTLVFDSTRVRQRPGQLVETVPAAALDIDFPGALSDKWQIGDRKIGIARTERSRLRAWADAPTSVS